MDVAEMTEAGFTLHRPGAGGYAAMGKCMGDDDRSGDTCAVSMLYGEAGASRWWLACTSPVAMKRMLLHGAPASLGTREVAGALGVSLAEVRLGLSCANEILKDGLCRLFFDIEDKASGAGADARAAQFIAAVVAYGSTHWNEYTRCSRHGDAPINYTTCRTCRLADVASGAFDQRVVFSASTPAIMSFHIAFPYVVFADLPALRKAVGRFVAWLTRHRARYPACFRTAATSECVVDESFYSHLKSMRMPTMSKVGRTPRGGLTLVRPLVYAPHLSYIACAAPLSAADAFELGTVQLFVQQHVQAGHVWSIGPPYVPYRIHGDKPGRDTSSKARAAAREETRQRAQASADAQSRILDYVLTPERLGACWDRATARYVPKIGFYWTFRVDAAHPQFCPGMAVRRFDGWARGEKPTIERNRCVYLPRGTLPRRLIEKRASYTHRKSADVSIMVTSDGKVLSFCHEKCCTKGVCIHGPDAALAALYGQAAGAGEQPIAKK